MLESLAMGIPQLELPPLDTTSANTNASSRPSPAVVQQYFGRSSVYTIRNVPSATNSNSRLSTPANSISRNGSRQSQNRPVVKKL